ncbi:MAG: arginine--tRNA ligase [Nitrososphaeraceae archaeon]
MSAKNLGYISVEREEDEENFDILDSPRKEFGDITCNIAFKLSKSVKRRPYEIARDMVEKELNPHIKNYQKNRSQISMLPALDVLVSAEAHPAGYINFRVNYAVLGRIILKEIITNPNYGSFDIGNGQHVIVEHTSVNPNKALHVGHLRNVILGDTIYRMLKATNHKTTVLNYVDDSGSQIADIVVGFMFAGFPLEPKIDSNTAIMKFDQYCGDEVYTKINRMYDIHPFLSEKRKYVLKEIEDPKSAIAKFAADITLRVLENQLKTCWRVKARYDLLNFESHIVSSGLWSSTLGMLRDRGLLILENNGKNKGCWIVRTRNGGDVEEADKVILRSDGTSTYIAKDIPYAVWKTGLVSDPFSYRKFAEQWDGSILWSSTTNDSDQKGNTFPDFQSRNMTITIIDSRQSRLQNIVSYILSSLKPEVTNDKTTVEKRNSNDYIHMGYEAVTISAQTAHMLGLDIGEREFMHMSGRRGIYINADYILDRLHEKAYDEAKKRNPTLSENSLNEIAEKIAIASVRYYMNKHDLNKIISFDIVESLSLDGDTGPYLQYSYARAQRILEKSGQHYDSNVEADFELLNENSETDLIKLLSKLDLVLEDSVVTLNPKTLARYAHELATTFNFYYEKIPILKEKNRGTMQARLVLVDAFGIVLKNVFDLLGIEALRRM